MAIGNWAFQLKYEPKQGAPQRMPLGDIMDQWVVLCGYFRMLSSLDRQSGKP